MSRPWKITLTLLLILTCGVGWFAFQLFGPSPPIVVSKETTYITEPLADDGLPDYAAYLLAKGREGVTVENNAAVPFLQAMWPAELEEEHRAPLCEHLQMKIPTATGMFNPLEDEEFGAQVKEWLETQVPASTKDGDGRESEPSAGQRMGQLFETVGSRPWRRGELPLLAEWIDGHAARYDLLHDAARRQRFYLPSPSFIVDPDDVLVNAVQPAMIAREAAYCLMLRGYLYLGEGNVAAAWGDCEAMYRLAALVPDDSDVLVLTGTAMEHIAGNLYLTLLEHPDLTAPIARQMLAFHLARPKGRNLHSALEPFARFSYSSQIMAFAGQRDGGTAFEAGLEERNPLLRFKVAVDWNTAMRIGNSWLDKLALIAQMEDRGARKKAVEQWEKELDDLMAEFPGNVPRAVVSRSARSRVMGERMSAHLLRLLSIPFLVEDRIAARAHLHPVAAALAVYRQEQGEYPETLELLVPDFLVAAPIDSYGNGAKYRRTDNGYLLYSIGANGIDERGSNAFPAVYEGYSIEFGEEEAVRGLLGLPARTENAEREGGADDKNGAKRSLWDHLPRHADDFAIRLPTLQSQLLAPPTAEEE